MNDISKLELLRIRSATVLVGETELVLKTSTLMQQLALANALGKIDPSPLLEAARPIVDKAGGADFVPTLLASGAVLWREALRFLGTAGGSVLAEVAGILLDNERNLGFLDHLVEDDRTLDGRRYVESQNLRNWIAGTVTPRQALFVLTTAIELNDYGAVGEALAALAKRAAKAASAATSPRPQNDPPETDSSAAKPPEAETDATRFQS